MKTANGSRPSRIGPTVRKVLVALGVAATILFCLFPFYWLINLSLRTGSELSEATLVPNNPTLTNYRSILANGDFLVALRNSATVAVVTTTLALIIGAPAAYALAKLPIKRKTFILGGILSITTFPAIAVAAPLFTIWTKIGLYNTVIGLILPYLVFTLPLGIFIMVAFFKEIPTELEEAAAIDGLDPWRAFLEVIVPLSTPGLVTAGLLTFIFAWNEFLLAITLTSTPEARTVPAAIAFFTGSIQYEQPLGTIAAASVLISVPLIALVIIFQRRIVSGLVAGAVKG